METLASTEAYVQVPQKQQQQPTAQNTNKADAEQTIAIPEEVKQEVVVEQVPVYSITVKTPSLRRPKSTTFSDWRGQISRPVSAGKKSGLKLDIKRPKSTPFLNTMQDIILTHDGGKADIKVGFFRFC